jgi:hypothetical protein
VETAVWQAKIMQHTAAKEQRQSAANAVPPLVATNGLLTVARKIKPVVETLAG